MCHMSYGMNEEDITSSQGRMGLYSFLFVGAQSLGGCWRVFCCHIGFIVTVYVDRGSTLRPVEIG